MKEYFGFELIRSVKSSRDLSVVLLIVKRY